MNDNTNKISNILPQIQLLKDKYEELAAVTGEDYNVFSILGVETDEVRTHSAFLADLLNPQGAHRQGAAFQKLFLKVALNHSELEKDSKTFQVRKEAFTGHGRIDILLEKDDACIVIENKIYADDQDAQMERYYDYATSKRLSEKQIELVYLTLDGSPPSEGSLGKLPEENVKCLSYSEDIINWLEECIKLQEVQRIFSIREIVFQYRDLLERLTGQSTNRRYSMELKDILAKDKNYELIPDMEQAILEFKVHAQLKFWEELARIMPDRVGNSSIHAEASEDIIRRYYQGGKNSHHYGTTFKLDSFSWEQTKIALRVAIEGGSILYGFILFDKAGHLIKSCKDKSFDELAKKLSDNDFKRSDWYVRWKYPARKITFPAKFSDSISNNLLDDTKRTELVQEFVTEIADAVKQLKDNLN